MKTHETRESGKANGLVFLRIAGDPEEFQRRADIRLPRVSIGYAQIVNAGKWLGDVSPVQANRIEPHGEALD
jgi:hypothetical protein